MKRWHEDYPITYREWKKHHRSHVESNVERNMEWKDGEYVLRTCSIWEVDCPCDTQIGRFRKMDAWDCGNPQCYMCHSDKYPKREITYQEWCAEKKLEEGIEDYWEERLEREDHVRRSKEEEFVYDEAA